jgi:osmoprotectant transport system ATP-binding protein
MAARLALSRRDSVHPAPQSSAGWQRVTIQETDRHLRPARDVPASTVDGLVTSAGRAAYNVRHDRQWRAGPLFALDAVARWHGQTPALDGVSLDFPSGTVTAVIGSSGSGKSTLLRLLLGLDWPDRGRVLIDGVPLSRDGCRAVRHRTGYVIQHGGLFPHLSARDNLALLPRHLRWPRRHIDARIEELAALTRLPPDALRRLPAELSGGQCQRVALMRALMTDPPALLLDEPLGSLDPIVRFELQEQFRQLFQALRKTVILVTHDLPEAAFMAPRLVLLQRGRVVQDGTLDELRQRPAGEFVRRFLAAQRALPPP